MRISDELQLDRALSRSHRDGIYILGL